MKMKNTILSLIGLIGILVSLQSCKEDIELIGDFEETAVVYGILDQSEELHFIKVTRAFIGDGTTDNNSIATIPDSSYFANVTGTVTEVGHLNRVFELRDTVVANKETNGIFYAPEQKLYYFKTEASGPNALSEDATYQLNLSINDGEFQISSETELVSGVTENISSKNIPYNFVNSQGEYVPTLVTMSNTGNSHRINVKLNIEFTEWVGSTPTVNSFDWGIGESQVTPNESRTFSVSGQSFYEVVKAHLTNDINIDKRTFNSISTIITAGSEDLQKYIAVNQPSSSLAQSKPDFTNLTASNGHKVIGIFSSRKTITIYDPLIDPTNSPFISALSSGSRKDLCIGSITAGYLFCSDHPGDLSQNYSCN